jgi:hypothetical protein
MEIAMVATVIAILALIVIPIFRNRVNEAKIAAARADISSLMKAEILAHADTDFYYRLEDLDNVQMAADASTQPPSLGITIETPPIVYYAGPGSDTNNPRGLDLPSWRVLAGTQNNPKFKGPYATLTRTEEYNKLRTAFPILFRNSNGDQYSAIRDLPSGSALLGNSSLYDSEQNRIPVDPWGNPYLFFPENPLETSYSYNAIYSMGPDGLPADDETRQVYFSNVRQDYTREGKSITDPTDDLLGKGDDLEVRF